MRGLTTSTAVLEAFETLGVSRPAVITPYPEATNVMEKGVLEGQRPDRHQYRRYEQAASVGPAD